MDERLKRIRESERKSHEEIYTDEKLYATDSWLKKPIKTVRDKGGICQPIEYQCGDFCSTEKLEEEVYMYLSEYCDVKYEENYNVVFVKWKKFCCREDYRKPLEYALEIIDKYKCDYVADTRDGFENIEEDTKWVADYFMPKAVEKGCKCIYFIIDKDNSLKEELEGQAQDSADLIEFKYIYGLEELADVLMYYNDVLLCYGISAEELKKIYTEKFEKNMKRW